MRRQLTLLYAVLAYEGLRHALVMLWERRRLDPWMAVATLFTVYPNFYSFFASFNYINDQFYQMWWTQVRLADPRVWKPDRRTHPSLPWTASQTFFSVTEMLVALACFQMVDLTRPVPPAARMQLLWANTVVASVHLVQSSIDQGF